MSTKKIITGVIIIIILVVVGYFVFGGDKIKLPLNKTNDTTMTDKTEGVATVNGKVISKASYETQLAGVIASLKTQGVDVENADTLSKIKTQVLNDSINNELIAGGILKAGIKPSTDDIEKQIQTIKQQTGGEEGFKTELVKNNLTETQLRENISQQLAVQTYLLQNVDISSITVSDEEIKQFYDEYSKAQKDSGQKDVPALKDLKEQIKQQITANKQQVLVNNFITSLREKADIKISM